MAGMSTERLISFSPNDSFNSTAVFHELQDQHLITFSTTFSHNDSGPSTFLPPELFENVTNSTSGAPFNVWLVGSYWLWRTAATVVLILGTFGNIMCLIVLRRLKSTTTSSINIYLTTLAVSDTIALYFGLGSLWGEFNFNYDVFAVHSFTCKTGPWILNIGAATSSWCLVAMTIQRAASVVFPHKVKAVCTRGATKAVVACVFSFQVLFYSHILYGADVVDGVCIIADPKYREFWLGAWVTMDMVVFSVLPFCLIAITNAVLVWHLVASVAETKSRMTPSENSSRHVTHRKKQASSTTLTIVVMSLTFLITTCPVTVFNVVSNVNGPEAVAENPYKLRFLYHLFFLVVSCNFAVNFYLYCLTGTKFRQSFVDLVSGCCQKATLPLGQSQGKSVTSQVEVNDSLSINSVDRDDDAL